MMNNKEKGILQNLLNLYVGMYSFKDLFNKKYFKYPPNEVEKVISYLQMGEKKKPEKKKKPISEIILSINSEEQVEAYYLENLQYNRNDKMAKEECLKKITLNELKHLCGILYSSPLRKNIRKCDLLDLIGNYFERIGRARSLKP